MKSYLIIFLCLLLQVSCAQNSFRQQISDINTFNSLKGKALNNKFSNTEAIKVVYDVKSKEIYFLDAKKFKFHHEFCSKKLGYSNGLQYFNNECYNDNKKYRKYLLGNIIHIVDSDIWALELAASDQMAPNFIHKLFNVVRQSTFFSNELKFYLNSQRLMNLKKNELGGIPTVNANYLFQNLKEQSIEKGESVGILKKYNLKNGDILNVKENEIIIINAIPNYLPKVKGIVVTQLLTPLSHLVILAKNRNIPLYTDVNAWDNENFNQLLNKKVKFIVKDDSYEIELTSEKIITKKSNPIRLKKNESENRIINLNKNIKENYTQFLSIGSKAQNLFYLKMLEKRFKNFKTPEHCYAIPFYYYEEHIRTNDIDQEIQYLINIPLDSVTVINQQLKKIRALIKDGKINNSLIVKMETILESQQEFKKFRFRSSTNSEDIEGFNGAGLYSSKSAVLGDATKTIELAIKSVWASVWNEKAFWERSIFNIKQNSVSMAILVHRSFPNEVANGVLISKNLYRKYNGITVNVQVGENSVVEPENGNISDEFYAYDFNSSDEELSIDYRSISNLNNGNTVLNKEEIMLLFKTVPKLQRSMNRLWKKHHRMRTSYPLDIEFKLVGESRQLYLKQARPYLE